MYELVSENKRLRFNTMHWVIFIQLENIQRKSYWQKEWFEAREAKPTNR